MRKINLVIGLEGLVVVGTFLFQSVFNSTENASFLYWVLAAFLLSLLPIWAGLSTNINQRLATWLDRPGYTVMALLLLLFALAGAGSLLAVLFSRYGRWFGGLKETFDAGWPLAVWLVLAILQTLVGLAFTRRQKVFSAAAWKQPSIFPFLTLISAVSAAILHWMILIFNLPLFDIQPGWFWKFNFKPFSPHDWIFALLTMLILPATWLLLNRRLSNGRMLLVLAVLGICLQFGFGFIEGQGAESLRLKYLATSHKVYAEYASDDPVFWNSLSQYDRYYGNDIYLGTKPPGLLMVYMLMQQISAVLFHPILFADRVEAVTTLIGWVFPLLSMAVCWPLYWLAKRFEPDNNPLLAVLFFITAPNVVLIPLFLDQAFYPLLFCANLLLWQTALQKRSRLWAGLSGLAMSFAIYFTFSMLPLAPLALAWLGFEVWRQRDWVWPRLRPWLGLSTAMGGGLIIGLVLQRLLLNYDILQRYAQAMTQHRQIKAFQTGLDFVLQSTWVNTLDIGAWSGFPLVILFLVSVFYAARRLFQGQASALDSLVLGFTVTYLALNLFGQTRGEVGRIWIFMLPVVLLGAIQTLKALTPSRHSQVWVYLLLLVQCLTVWLTYHFQDFFA